MKALQLHYTSCRRGQSGSAGFQVRSLTPGITPGEQREIERRGLYRPPRDANQEPSAEEIARDFPRALRFYSLESGRNALTLACYTGRDYTGRWGNFFAHTLVLEGEPLPMWPIDYYEWDGWQAALTADQDTEETPAPLPVADLAEVPRAESFALEELSAFLAEEPQRRQLLARMARAMLLGGESSRAVVIRDTPLNGLYWIACLQKLLPLPHARRLSYSTYQHDPRGCAAVNATTGETDFRFDEAERSYQLYEFDLSTGAHSEVPDRDDDFPALAAGWLVDDHGRLARFHEHMSLYDHDIPDAADLEAAASLFELSEDSGSEASEQRLVAMISFATRYATAGGRARLMEVLAQRIAAAGDWLQRPEDYLCVVQFLADGAAGTGEADHRRITVDAWLALLRERLHSTDQDLAPVEEARRYIAEVLPEHEAELARAFLDGESWQSVADRLPQLDTGPLQYLLGLTVHALRSCGQTPLCAGHQLHRVIAAAVAEGRPLEELAHVALGLVHSELQDLVAMARLLVAQAVNCRPAERRESARIMVGRALGQVLARLAPEVASKVRRELDQEEGWSLLLGEWQWLCDTAEDKRAEFASYDRGVLQVLPGYRKHNRGKVAAWLLGKLEEPHRSEQALQWMRGGELAMLPEEVAGRCVQLVNRTISLDPKDKAGDDSARLVSAEARRLRVDLSPDRPLLRQVLTAAVNGAGFTTVQLNQLPGSLMAIDRQEYRSFLEIFLPQALSRASNLGEHERALQSVWRSDETKLIRMCYREFFKRQRKGRWNDSLHGALMFWLRLDPAGSGRQHLVQLEDDGRKGLCAVLAGLGEKNLDQVDERVGKAHPDEHMMRLWLSMLEDVQARKQSWWRRLKTSLLGSPAEQSPRVVEGARKGGGHG